MTFPFFLFGGVALALLGAALHRGRGVRYVMGPAVAAASLLMVRASLDGFSRTAAVLHRAEDELGLNLEEFTPGQLQVDPVFESLTNTWPSWHYPFAFTSLALWLAAAVAGIGLVRPNRRWTVVTTVLATALVAWVSWKYFDVAEAGNRFAE